MSSVAKDNKWFSIELLNAGANWKIKNSNDETAISIARKSFSQSTLLMLQDLEKSEPIVEKAKTPKKQKNDDDYGLHII